MTHLLLDVTHQCATAMNSLTDANPVFLTTDEKADLIRHCLALESAATELRLRTMLDADDLVEESGCRDIGQWLTVNTGMNRTTAAADTRLAGVLSRYPHLGAAMAEGRVTRDQAGVIGRALDRLPDDLDPDRLDEAERYLVAQARHFGPHDLAALGEKVLEVVAPEDYDALEARRLLRQDEAARRNERLALKARGDGMTRISGLMLDDAAVRFATILYAFTNPRRPGADRDVFDPPVGIAAMPYPQRAAEGFRLLLESWDPNRLPVHGGDMTTVVVAVTLDQLRTELATATLVNASDDDAGEAKIPASEARRLACNARIVPVVLGSAGEVLDLGRSARLFSRSQQRALVIRDRTCRSEGCHIPGTWSEAHHWLPWSEGGATDLANAVLLCSHHHHLVHHPDWSAPVLGGSRQPGSASTASSSRDTWVVTLKVSAA